MEGAPPGVIPFEDDVTTINQGRHNSTTTPHILRDFHAHSPSQLDSSEEGLQPRTIQIDPTAPLPGLEAARKSEPQNISSTLKSLLRRHWAESATNHDLEDGVFSRTEKISRGIGGSFSIPRIRAAFQEIFDEVSVDELARRVEYFFPLRAHLRVQICDFGDGRAARMSVKLGDMEREMFRKPDWAVVRWIHAPLGVGLYHASVEGIFLNGVGQECGKRTRDSMSLPKGKPFNQAGRAGWPYLETEIVNIRSFREMDQMRKAALILREHSAVRNNLDLKVLEGDNNDFLGPDVLWRADHLGLEPTFWETAKSDLPWLLSDGAFGMKSPTAVSREITLSLKRQTLQDHPYYQDAYIARDSFRCFHRGDGYVLSLSPANGIDYLDKRLRHIDHDRRRHQYRDKRQDEEPSWPSARTSAIAQSYAEFQFEGVRKWSQKTPEWLMVFLLTEIVITPHSQRSGYGAPSILDAYDAIIHKLIERKFEPWAKNHTVSLVQSYLASRDELAALARIYKTKLDFLCRLKEDCQEIEAKHQASQAHQLIPEADDYYITMTDRVAFAITAVKDDYCQCDQLYTNLTASLNALFQLRSIEQNDRAIHADSQSRAVFAFTGVTIVFLPLMFMTSYFGMNVSEITGTASEKSQAEFWKLCAPVTFSVISLVALYIWLERVRAFQRAPLLNGRG